MNKAAFNHAQGGHDDYGDAVRSRLTNLRSAVADARDALNVFGRGEAAKSRRPNPTTGADNALVARIDALLEDLPRHEGYCPATIAETYRTLRAEAAAVSPEAAAVVAKTPEARELLSTRRHARTSCGEIRAALGQIRAIVT